MKMPRFRAFLKSNQKMYDVLTLDIIDQKALIENNQDINRPLRGYAKISEIELMQHTGLTIKHRKKPRQDVYEGDILKGKYYFRGVGWYDTGEGDYSIYGPVVYKDGKFVCCGFDLGDLVYEDRIKIIGNIYENPELLGG